MIFDIVLLFAAYFIMRAFEILARDESGFMVGVVKVLALVVIAVAVTVAVRTSMVASEFAEFMELLEQLVSQGSP